MPKFKVQQLYEFRGEQPPSDLLNEDDVLVPAGGWPRRPLLVEAEDQDAAIEKTRRLKRRRASMDDCFPNAKISEARFQQLCAQKNPDGRSEIASTWSAEPTSDDERLVMVRVYIDEEGARAEVEAGGELLDKLEGAPPNRTAQLYWTEDGTKDGVYTAGGGTEICQRLGGKRWQRLAWDLYDEGGYAVWEFPALPDIP